MTEVKHTPTPWEKCGGATPSYTCIKAGDEYIVYGMADNLVDEEHGNPIAAPDMWKQQANAAHIVKCVNLHDELVGTIKELLKVYNEPDEAICCNGRDCGCHGASVRQQAEHYAREALKKAGAL